MILVKCEMCDELIELSQWSKGICFICLKCAKILQKIKKQEIQLNYIFSTKTRMKLFDTLRFKEVKK